MKKQLLPVIAAITLTTLPIHAANIYWVTFHPDDATPSANAGNAGFTNAPDAGYTQLLRDMGHTVTRYVTTATPDVALLNTADLVILSRSVPSGHYQTEPSPADWNGITAPMIVMNGYLTRANRLGLTTGDTMVDVNSMEVRLRVEVPQHPIFNGVALDATNLMVNPYAQRVVFTNAFTGATNLQVGISVNTSALRAGGSRLAVVGTPGDAAVNGMMIGEFAAGLTTQRGGTLGAKRLVFFSGSRESGITSEGAGIFDLMPDGKTLFSNAVQYLIGDNPPVVSLTPNLLTNMYPGDTLNFNPGVYGSEPLTYQWYKNNQVIDGAMNLALSIPNSTSADAGEYKIVVNNAFGSATSSVVRVEYATLPSPSITNGIISYWPLNAVNGDKTPDLVSGYDMTLVKMGATNLTSGKYGSAFQFYDVSQNSLERVHNPGEDLPIYQHEDFTVSLWVKGPIQSDHRVFCEGSTTATQPMFSLGTHNGGTDGTVDIYIRNDAGATVGDHRHSTAVAFDDTWHNIIYTQRRVGEGLMRALLYVDGVLDPVEITPVRPLTANATAIGAVRRASSSAWFNGAIDEVAVWERALTPDEIQILQVTSITNPPSRLQPLAINKFLADVPAVGSNSTTTLRWDVSKDATQVQISPLGDVTAQTTSGVGSRSITVTQDVNYVLTVTRGSESLSATTRVAVVTGVAPGWELLDNFDQYREGTLYTNGYWAHADGTPAVVTNYNGNPAAMTRSTVTYLPLRNQSLLENQTRTLFFRIIPGSDAALNATNLVGLTDKSQRGYGDAFQNIGPVMYPTPLTNTTYGVETNAWYVGGRNGAWGNNTSAPIEYPLYPLQTGAVYNVWIDMHNVPLANFSPDTYTVYIQKEGDASRTVLFQDYTSDRDLSYVDPVLGSIAPILDKLILLGNSGTHSALFDDFYISSSAFNATVPRPYGFTGSVVVQPATLGLTKSGNQLQIQFTSGVLQQAPSLTGPWTDVPGSPTSPYTVTPSGDSMFFRTR